MKKSVSVFTIMSLVLSLFLLVLSLSACKGHSTVQPSPTPTPTYTPSPTNTGATPLTILSVAGGEVLVQRAGENSWIDGVPGMTLDVEDKIKTEAGGHATITFFEGSTIELDGSTEITLSELGQGGTASHICIAQALGKTVSRVKKLVDPASSYEVETPSAVAAVRGTTLGVSVDEEGTTVVSNIQGEVSVTAGGEEVILQEGTHTTVELGGTPGEPESNITSTPTPTPSPTPAKLKLGLSKACDRQTAFPGDNLTYTYLVTNQGDVPLSGISVDDDKAGSALYSMGDNDADGVLDIGETWVFYTEYTIKDGEIGQLANFAQASGTGPDNQQVTASASAVVAVNDIVIEITSIVPDQVVSQNVVIAGTVNDPSITVAVLSVNGAPVNIDIDDGQFSTLVTLSEGVNVINITVNKGDITRNITVIFEPATPPPTETYMPK